MPILTHYCLVRVIQLLHPLEEYDGWNVGRRPPQIGDIGTVVDILQEEGLPNKYVVEASDGDGITIWLADFDAEELELVE